MWFIFLNIGTDCPSMKYLYQLVRPRIGIKWYDVGLELLGEEDEKRLFDIKISHNDYEECAVKMLQLWLEKKVDASWNQLIQALRQPNINLSYFASRIENMLLKENDVLFQGQLCE